MLPMLVSMNSGSYHFGYVTAHQHFKDWCSKILEDAVFSVISSYIDDVLRTVEKHLEHLGQVFDRPRAVGLKLCPSTGFACPSQLCQLQGSGSSIGTGDRQWALAPSGVC